MSPFDDFILLVKRSATELVEKYAHLVKLAEKLRFMVGIRGPLNNVALLTAIAGGEELNSRVAPDGSLSIMKEELPSFIGDYSMDTRTYFHYLKKFKARAG